VEKGPQLNQRTIEISMSVNSTRMPVQRAATAALIAT
jgi:hypothetical protein